MAKEFSISEFRNVTIAFDTNTGKDIVNQTAQVAAPVDLFKTCVQLVKENEAAYARYGALIPDLTAKSIKAVGANPNVIHTLLLTTVLATGSYIFVYVSTAPNAEEV